MGWHQVHRMDDEITVLLFESQPLNEEQNTHDEHMHMRQHQWLLDFFCLNSPD